MIGRRLAAALLGLLFAVPAGAEPDQTDQQGADAVRGITISCRRNGPGEWDSPRQMAATMKAARDVGATWVTIHPYARIGNDGSIRYRANVQDDMFRVAAEQAHAHGLKLLIKPHIGYWGSRFSWRGEIAFEDAQDVERFFRDYRDWITDQARLAEKHGVDAFCLGTELKGTLQHEAQWRSVVQAVRDQYDGPLTYAANWDSYQRVPFWDVLDVVGIQAYFPVSDDAPPTEAALKEGWQKVAAELDAFSKKTGKPIVFTELGYTTSINAGKEPWAYQRLGDRDVAEATKRLCMRVALEHIEQDDTVIGSFIWKWFTEPNRSGREFVFQLPEHKQIMREAWVKP